jgi:hypothetical protein
LCFQPFQLFILEKLEAEAVAFEDAGQVLKDWLDNQNNTSDNEKVRGLEEGGPGRKMMCLSLLISSTSGSSWPEENPNWDLWGEERRHNTFLFNGEPVRLTTTETETKRLEKVLLTDVHTKVSQGNYVERVRVVPLMIKVIPFTSIGESDNLFDF